jgi:predicted acyl esterase
MGHRTTNFHMRHYTIAMPNQTREILSVDETTYPYRFEQNVSVKLSQPDGLIRCNIYRPKSSEAVPVIVTYGPYGKDIGYNESAAS